MEEFEGVEYFEARVQDGRIVLEPVKMTAMSETSLEKAREKIASLGLTEKDIDDAVSWARRATKK
jgi:hypothetical protein